jgi:hypothetical protein
MIAISPSAFMDIWSTLYPTVNILLSMGSMSSRYSLVSAFELQTVHEILESNTMVSGLFFDSIYQHKGPENLNPAVPRMVLLDAKEGIIQSYVERTGGLALQADKGNIKDRFALLIRRLRTRYSIGYVSSNQAHDGKFRKIKLKVTPEVEKREGSVGIITKRGYYAR